MQIKTTMRYYFTPSSVALIKTTTTKMENKYWQGYGEISTFVCCRWECIMMQPLWKTFWQFLKKSNIVLPYDPAIPLHPREMKAYIHTEACIWMFIAALFIEAKRWKHPNACQWMNGKNRLWYINTVGFCSTINRRKVLTHGTVRWTLKTLC